jgi:hypothetical protein
MMSTMPIERELCRNRDRVSVLKVTADSGSANVQA